MSKEKGGQPGLAGPGILDRIDPLSSAALRDARQHQRGPARLDERHLLPARRRYARGLVYRDAGASIGAALERGVNVLILSGAYGVVLADEPIGDYERTLTAREWPDGLLSEILAEYAGRHGIDDVAGFAGSSSYEEVIRATSWPASVRRARLFTPRDVTGYDKTRVVGAALRAYLDSGLDPSTWRDDATGGGVTGDDLLGSRERQDPSPVRALVPADQVSPGALAEIRQAFERYAGVVRAADLAPNTERTYLTHSENFVRWLEGQFEPGGRRR